MSMFDAVQVFQEYKEISSQQPHPNFIHPWSSLCFNKPSPISSFHKKTYPRFLSKSIHLPTLVLSSKVVLGTPLPHSIHQAPFPRFPPPSTSIIFLSAVSCRFLVHLVGFLVMACFEAELRENL